MSDKLLVTFWSPSSPHCCPLFSLPLLSLQEDGEGKKKPLMEIINSSLFSPLWNNSLVSVLSTLTSFLLLSFLLVFVDSGPFCSLLVIGHILPASLPLVLRVRELFITGYPLICGTDCNHTTQTLWLMTSQTDTYSVMLEEMFRGNLTTESADRIY